MQVWQKSVFQCDCSCIIERSRWWRFSMLSPGQDKRTRTSLLHNTIIFPFFFFFTPPSHFTLIPSQFRDTPLPSLTHTATAPQTRRVKREQGTKTRWQTLHSTSWAMLPSTVHPPGTPTTIFLLTTVLEPSSRKKKMPFPPPFLSGEVFFLKRPTIFTRETN